MNGSKILIECRVCKNKKESSFMKSEYGKPCHICKSCDGKGRNARYKKKPRSRARQDRINAKLRKQTSDGSNVAYLIYRWSRKSDKKKGLQNDLTREFVEQSISHGCIYCGNCNLRMTLDRIDNSIGHIRSNVVPACIRCNYFRRDVPYDAWISIVPAIRQAVQKGLFGDWDGRNQGRSIRLGAEPGC